MSVPFGARPASISCTNQDSHFASHNDRTSKETRENVWEEYSNLNIIYKNQSLEDAFDEVFGSAKKAYNQKQRQRDIDDPKHKHATIGSYIDHIIASKNFKDVTDRHSVQTEWIISVSDMWDQLADRTTPEGHAFYKELTKTIAEDLQREFPYIHFTQIIAHLDEVTHIDKDDPHLANDPEFGPEGADLFGGFHIHLGGFYWAEGYKTGMDRQYSERKAQALMGFTGKDRKVKVQAAMMECIERSINKLGMIRLIMNTDHEHFKSPGEYKEYAKKMAQINSYLERGYEQVNRLSNEIEDKSGKRDDLDEQIRTKTGELKSKKEDLGTLESEISRKQTDKKTLNADIAALSQNRNEIMDEIVGDSIGELNEAWKDVQLAEQQIFQNESLWKNESVDFEGKKFTEQLDDLVDVFNSMRPIRIRNGTEGYFLSKKAGDLGKQIVSTIQNFIRPIASELNRIWEAGRRWLRSKRKLQVTKEELEFYNFYKERRTQLFSDHGEQGMRLFKQISDKINKKVEKSHLKTRDFDREL